MTEFKLTGGEAIEKLLNELPRQLRRRALNNAVRQGASIIRNEARSIAKKSGLSDSYTKDIVISSTRGARGLDKDAVLLLGVRRAHSRLAHIFEFGTSRRERKSGGATGFIKATPHLRPAVDLKGRDAIAVISNTLRQNLEVIAKSLRDNKPISLTQASRRDIDA